MTWFRGEHTEDFLADPEAPATWRTSGEANGTLGDLAPHMVNAALALAGVGLSVAGAIPGFPMGKDQYRSLRFDNTTADNDVPAFGTEPDVLFTLEDYLDGV